MKITFFSNFMSHHQEGLSNALFELTNGEYRFVACTPIAQQRIKLGFEDMNKKYDYIIRAYENGEQYELAKELALSSDVIIYGSGNKEFLDIRMTTHKLTFMYCERIFKKGIYRRFIPMTYKKIYNTYIKRKKEPLYILCASAYTSYDLSLCGFPAEKCFKWGYFPTAKKHNISELISLKNPLEILWAGRFIDWKHPEVPVYLAENLKKDNISFHLTMLGDGIEMRHIKNLIIKKNLEDVITLEGSVPPDVVTKRMEKASIFLSTSDFQEGWGAVLNEAMSSGCACIASHAIGAAPYLIKDSQNGFMYKNANINDLCNKVKLLLNNHELCSSIGIEAYKTIENIWNDKNAANKLIELINNINSSQSFGLDSDVCSSAQILKNNWY